MAFQLSQTIKQNPQEKTLEQHTAQRAQNPLF
jgi:hypothetical protein